MIQTKEQLDALCYTQRDAFLNSVKIDGQRILDIGCGDGRFTLQHFAGATSVHGLDPKQDKIDDAIKSLEKSSHTTPQKKPVPSLLFEMWHGTFLDKYKKQRNTQFTCADIIEYPLAPSSIDIAIFLRSF